MGENGSKHNLTLLAEFVVFLISAWMCIAGRENVFWLSLFGIGTLILSLFWNFKPLSKEWVDILYYSVAIFGVLWFFAASFDERTITRLKSENTTGQLEMNDEKKKVLAMRDIVSSPDKEFLSFTSQLQEKLLAKDRNLRWKWMANDDDKPRREWKQIASMHSLDELAEFQLSPPLVTISPVVGAFPRSEEYFSIGIPEKRVLGSQALAWFFMVAKSSSSLEKSLQAKENRLSELESDLWLIEMKIDEQSKVKTVNAPALKLLMLYAWPYVLIYLLGLKIRRHSLCQFVNLSPNA